jgi:hypothetical protein
MNVLRWGHLAGTLEPGKQADLILLDSRDFASPYLAPDQNPIDTLIYRGKSTAVDTVIVGGEILYQGRKHKRIESRSILKKLKESVIPPAKKNEGPEAELLPYLNAVFESWDQDPTVPFHKFNSVE